MKYKMVALDMDGTLLNERSIIPRENQRALEILFDKGIHIVIATGRTYSHAMLALEGLGIPIILISNNGNAIWDPVAEEKIAAKHIDPIIFYEIVEHGSERELLPIVHADNWEEGYELLIYEDPNHSAYKAYLEGGTSFYRRVQDFGDYPNPRAMMICYIGEINQLIAFEKAIKTKYHDRVHAHIVTNIKNVGPLLEISALGGTKWDAILEYGNNFGIKPEEIVAVGDDNNDISMLANAGLGVAMANGSHEAQKAASMVAHYTNKEAGVAKILADIFGLII